MSFVNIKLTPEEQLAVLSQSEVAKLLDTSQGGLYRLYRKCSLAVLNSGIEMDDAQALLDRYESFEIRLLQRERGLRVELIEAPATAFVEGKIIRGIKQLLFSVLRDILYVANEIQVEHLSNSAETTNAVFQILRNAEVLKTMQPPNMVVCWGGHSISRDEYDYTKEVGYEMGLRDLDICTGCGGGAMKGPMKGATIGHAKQRNGEGRYLGLSEPGIIAAEPPNAIINELVIMPDIEKRLEAFVRVGHAIVVFPGGVGTAEEILYLIGILLHEKNRDIPYPLIFTGPAGSEAYFHQIDEFIGATLGSEAQAMYQIIIDDPAAVASAARSGMREVRRFRRKVDDAYYFNWRLHIDESFQKPFAPTHANMASLNLSPNQDKAALAANLRCVFSGIVAGNVKEDGIRAVTDHGPFQIQGDAGIMALMDKMLRSFVEQKRMKLPGDAYEACYEIVAPDGASEI